MNAPIPETEETTGLGIVDRITAVIAGTRTILDRIDQITKDNQRFGLQTVHLLDLALDNLKKHVQLLGALQEMEKILQGLKVEAKSLALGNEKGGDRAQVGTE